MYEIMRKLPLNPEVTLMDIHAPHIASKAKAGQFIIYRLHELGERVPLTIAGADADTGAVTIIFQKVGRATSELDRLDEGDAILDFVGPLGVPTHIEGIKKAAVVGGGLGCAIAWPVAKALHAQGTEVDMIAGFRNRELVILEDEMRAASKGLHICTDDGSYGVKGLVTNVLNGLLENGASYDRVIAIGPLIMMKFVCKLTEERKIPTLVSMNPIMVDGTGLCGCCRVTVGGSIRFACVDGPDFDGHLVDFDEAIRRSRAYAPQEREAACRLLERGALVNA